MARAFRAARDAPDKDFIKLVDFEPYDPSYHLPASFIASPIYDGTQKVGVLLFQMPIGKINEIMTFRKKWEEVGLGKSGESYLVGQDYKMRSNSRFLADELDERIRKMGTTILIKEIHTEGIEDALKGNSDTRIFPDYRGVSVLSAYSPLKIEDVHWVIVSEIDEAEAFGLVNSLKNLMLVIAGIATIAVIVLSIRIARSITNPIAKLRDAAVRVGKGDLDTQIEVTSSDEVGELATSFKKMTEDLRKTTVSRDYVDSIIKNMMGALMVVTPEGAIKTVNQATLDLLGYTEDELLDESVNLVVEEKAVFEDLVQKGLVSSVETTYLGKNGKKIPVLFSGSVMCGDDGKIQRIVSVALDITRRKRAQNKITHLNVVLRAIRSVNQLIVREKDRDRLLQGVCDGLIETRGYHHAWIVLMDESGNFVIGSQAGLEERFSSVIDRLKGGQIVECAKKALTQTSVKITKRFSDTCGDCPLVNQYKDGEAMTIRLQYQNKVYGIISVSVPVGMAKDEEEQALFQEVAQDIAFALRNMEMEEKHKKAEKKIKEYAEELKIRNLELKVETEKVTEADRLKSEFLANMSHEIRTPLSAISGAAYLLNKSSLSSEQRELCNIVAQSEKHLLQLINDILDLARIEAGEVRLEWEEFSLKETLKELISGFKLEAEKKGIKLDLVYPSHLPTRISAGKGKITQIVSNFLSNALKFTEEGSIEVMVDKEADSKIQILIKDTGVGIAEEKLSHIFNKFYQIDGTIRRKYSGTGLGLTIVKELAHILGGKIEVKSELKKGSTFSFSFPYRSIEEKVEEIVPDKEQTKLKPKIKGKAKKDINILIAEDDDFNYYIIDRFLKDYTTTRAKDGKDVLEKIEKTKYDLILMDIQMPEMDGLTATRKIREKNKDLPIIALTAKAMQGDEEKCLSAGCTDYISKPITPDELRMKVDRYTAGR